MTETSTSWLGYLTALGSIATPVLVLGLTAIGWRLRQGIERQHELEDKLREDRINTYNSVLEPFVIMLMSDQAWESDPKNRKKDKMQLGTQQMLSLEYRRAVFKMTLVAPDDVVRAHNNLMQYFFRAGDNQEVTSEASTVVDMIRLLGKFLLEIRKSMGNQSTELNSWDMMEWMMKDARELKERERNA